MRASERAVSGAETQAVLLYDDGEMELGEQRKKKKKVLPPFWPFLALVCAMPPQRFVCIRTGTLSSYLTPTSIFSSSAAGRGQENQQRTAECYA